MRDLDAEAKKAGRARDVADLMPRPPLRGPLNTIKSAKITYYDKYYYYYDKHHLLSKTQSTDSEMLIKSQ